MPSDEGLLFCEIELTVFAGVTSKKYRISNPITSWEQMGSIMRGDWLRIDKLGVLRVTYVQKLYEVVDGVLSPVLKLCAIPQAIYHSFMEEDEKMREEKEEEEELLGEYY